MHIQQFLVCVYVYVDVSVLVGVQNAVGFSGSQVGSNLRWEPSGKWRAAVRQSRPPDKPCPDIAEVGNNY